MAANSVQHQHERLDSRKYPLACSFSSVSSLCVCVCSHQLGASDISVANPQPGRSDHANTPSEPQDTAQLMGTIKDLQDTLQQQQTELLQVSATTRQMPDSSPKHSGASGHVQNPEARAVLHA